LSISGNRDKKISPGKWCGNIRLGLEIFFLGWNKFVLVTDKNTRGFSDLFFTCTSCLVNSEASRLDELDSAIRW